MKLKHYYPTQITLLTFLVVHQDFQRHRIRTRFQLKENLERSKDSKLEPDIIKSILRYYYRRGSAMIADQLRLEINYFYTKMIVQ